MNRKLNFLFYEITTCFYDCQLFCWIKYSQLLPHEFYHNILPILPIFGAKIPAGSFGIYLSACVEFDDLRFFLTVRWCFSSNENICGFCMGFLLQPADFMLFL
jgi:hypothetical protein